MPRLTIATLVLALCTSLPARASELDPRHVDAGATWMVHVDFEALGRSQLLRTLHAHGMHIENELDCDEIRSLFGIDPFAELRSLTMYGFDPAETGVVTVVTGGTALDAAFARLATKAKRTQLAGRDVVELERAGKPRLVALAASSARERRAVVATTNAALAQALTLLDGEAPSLASRASAADASRTRLAPRPAKNALVYATSVAGEALSKSAHRATYLTRALRLLVEIADLRGPEKDAFARPVRGLEYELVELDGELRTRVVLETESAAAADELERSLRARVARSNPEGGRAVVARLLAPLSIESPETRLHIGYRYGIAAWAADIVVAEKGERAGPGH